MPTTSTSRKKLSEVLTAQSSFAVVNAVDFNYASVEVGSTGSVDNYGVAFIYVAGNTQFEPYVAQDIAAAITAGGSPLKDGSVIAISVGDFQGKGFNAADTNLADTDAKMTVLYRGDAAILKEGIIWNGADAAAQLLFLAQLEAQRITTVAKATSVTPTYLSA
jgi:hypothetical protein